jgi:hypothetical protein
MVTCEARPGGAESMHWPLQAQSWPDATGTFGHLEITNTSGHADGGG